MLLHREQSGSEIFVADFLRFPAISAHFMHRIRYAFFYSKRLLNSHEVKMLYRSTYLDDIYHEIECCGKTSPMSRQTVAKSECKQ